LSVQEDSKGLAVQGQFAMKTRLGQEAYELLKMEAIKGLSIGYNSIVSEYDKEKDIRTLKEIELWEISLVTFPANINATVTGVKAFENVKTLREFEESLRDSGLSRAQAQYIVGLCKDSFGRRECSQEDISTVQILKAGIAQYLN